MSKARERLTVLWIAFFILNLTAAAYLYLGREIEMKDLKDLLTELNTAYAPYVGAFLTFYWTRRRASSTGSTSREQKFALALALGFASVWNLLISGLLLRLIFHAGTFESSLELMAFLRGIFTWFVAGSTGFFFGVGR